MQAVKPVLAKRIEATEAGLLIVLPDRQALISWEKCSPALAKASGAERAKAELSPGGYGVHWPLVDEDLTISGLLSKL